MNRNAYLSLVTAVCLLLFAPLPLAAAEAVELYAAEAPVDGEAVEERNQGISAALGKVLVKLTGSSTVANRAEAQSLLAEAPNYVQQYRYFRLPPSEEPLPEGAVAEEQRAIWVKFDEGSLDRALRARGLPLWGRKRPVTLVWLAMERGGARQLISPDSQEAMAATLRSQADQRGVVLRFPLLDLEDQANLKAADLWGGYESVIREASRRYRHDAILCGRLRQLGGDKWRIDWSLYGAAGADELHVPPAALDAALADGLDQAVDRLAARYVMTASGDGASRVSLYVGNVRGVEEYAAVMALIQSQNGVSRVTLRQAEYDQLQLDVWVAGDALYLKRGLDLEQRLEPMLTPLAEVVDPNRLDYRWR